MPELVFHLWILFLTLITRFHTPLYTLYLPCLKHQTLDFYFPNLYFSRVLDYFPETSFPYYSYDSSRVDLNCYLTLDTDLITATNTITLILTCCWLSNRPFCYGVCLSLWSSTFSFFILFLWVLISSIRWTSFVWLTTRLKAFTIESALCSTNTLFLPGANKHGFGIIPSGATREWKLDSLSHGVVLEWSQDGAAALKMWLGYSIYAFFSIRVIHHVLSLLFFCWRPRVSFVF